MIGRDIVLRFEVVLIWLRLMLSALIAGLPLVSVAEATTLHDTGQWSGSGSDWGDLYGSYAIHMAIARGEGTPYHSQVIWWSNSRSQFDGRELAWRPFTSDCSSWPDSNFIPIIVSWPGINAFCSGHTGIADGRMLVAGGNDSVNSIAGERGARVWQPGTAQSSSNWLNANQMREHRWYPTTTALADGRVLVLTGNQNQHHAIFGGRLDGAIPSQIVADSVRLYEPVPNGQWFQSVIPDTVASGPGSHKPAWREFHSGVDMELYLYDHFRSRQVYFGGRDASGQALNDTWLLRRDANLTGADFHYAWEKGPTTGLPDARSEHTAVGARIPNASMFVFGGLGNDSLTRNDLRQLYWNGTAFAWRTPADSGSAPSARYGHTAFYDEIPGPSSSTLHRMILFGGTDAVGHAPADSNLYEMRITSPSSVAWTVMTKRQLGWGSPSPRFGHAMDVDLVRSYSKVVNGSPLSGHVAFLFGGQTGSNAYSGELWMLWIFNDGTVGWERKDFAGNPPSARKHATLVYDPLQGREEAASGVGRAYVFGGEDGSGPVDKDQYEVDPFSAAPAWYKWAEAGAKASGHTTVIQQGITTARVAEVYTPATNHWATHTSANLLQEGYGPTFLTPGHSTAAGRVFSMGYDESAYHLDVGPDSSSGSWARYTNGDLGFTCESMVMYLPGKIMAAGGFNTSFAPESSFIGRTKKFDTVGADSSWQQAAYGSGAGSLTARRFHNLVILPDGKVIAIGGLRGFRQDAFAYATRHPQIWDPDGAGGMGAWSDSVALAEQPHIKNYHSTAILLPDGRVLSAGGAGGPDDDDDFADLYTPPYLFSGDTLATRPLLGALLGRWRYNTEVSFVVTSDTTIRKVALIRAPSTTHAFDQSERYIPLSLTHADDLGGGSRQYFVNAPADSFIAPPGDYMLWVLNSSGVPAIAPWIRVGSVYTGQFDTTPPDSLHLAVEFISCNAIYPVSWTAPGDDHSTNIALDYDIRYSTTPINDSNFEMSTQMSGIPIPKVPGTTQQADGATGLSTCTNYYFAGRARDRAENWSALGVARYKTLCVGGICGGLGESMQRSREGATALSGRERAINPLSAVPGIRTFATPATLEQSSTIRLVGTFTAGSEPHWQVTWEDLAGQSELLQSSASSLVVQEPVAGGGWKTRSAIATGSGSIGVRSLAKSGRAVFPAGSSIEAVEFEPIGYECTSAIHSRLGELIGTSEPVTSPEFAEGDTLELSYAAASGGEGEDCFFRVLAPTLTEPSHARVLPRADAGLPVAFALYPARPNPFSGMTTIRFDLPKTAHVRIEVFDVQGRRVTTLADRSQEAGRYSVSWNGISDRGLRAPAGLYLCRMRAGDFTAEKRISLLP